MQHLTVVGSGTMGNGIAHTFAQYGFEVALIDNQPAALERAITTIHTNLDRQIKKGGLIATDKASILARIKTYTSLHEGAAKADLVVEAATENESIKLDIFRELDRLCPAHTVLASNTSSISITKIASVTQRADRIIGMHFMNPVPVMKLVEVIKGYATSDETVDMVVALAKRLDKVPVEVTDYPGFVANRILMPLINEAVYTL